MFGQTQHEFFTTFACLSICFIAGSSSEKPKNQPGSAVKKRMLGSDQFTALLACLHSRDQPRRWKDYLVMATGKSPRTLLCYGLYYFTYYLRGGAECLPALLYQNLLGHTILVSHESSLLLGVLALWAHGHIMWVCWSCHLAFSFSSPFQFLLLTKLAL